MRPIDEFQQVRSDLFFWQGYEPAVKTDLSCAALATRAGLIFIDPLPLASDALAELTENFSPAAIVLTNANHERAAEALAKRFGGIPIHAHRDARGEIAATHWHEDDETILENVRLVHLPGFAKGEIALHRGDYLLVGDALINLPPHGFAMLPEKYCENAKLARASLQKLLALSFNLITFAHGLPIVSGARERLETLLGT